MFMRGEAANTIGLLSDVAHWKRSRLTGPENVGVFRCPRPPSQPTSTKGLPAFRGRDRLRGQQSRANTDLAAER